MEPNAPNTGLNAPETPENTSSPSAHPPFRGSVTSSSSHQVPGDMPTTSEKTRTTPPVDTEVDTAVVDLLKDAVEDESGEDWAAVTVKVRITTSIL